MHGAASQHPIPFDNESAWNNFDMPDAFSLEPQQQQQQPVKCPRSFSSAADMGTGGNKSFLIEQLLQRSSSYSGAPASLASATQRPSAMASSSTPGIHSRNPVQVPGAHTRKTSSSTESTPSSPSPVSLGASPTHTSQPQYQGYHQQHQHATLPPSMSNQDPAIAVHPLDSFADLLHGHQAHNTATVQGAQMHHHHNNNCTGTMATNQFQPSSSSTTTSTTTTTQQQQQQPSADLDFPSLDIPDLGPDGLLLGQDTSAFDVDVLDCLDFGADTGANAMFDDLGDSSNFLETNSIMLTDQQIHDDSSSTTSSSFADAFSDDRSSGASTLAVPRVMSMFETVPTAPHSANAAANSTKASSSSSAARLLQRQQLKGKSRRAGAKSAPRKRRRRRRLTETKKRELRNEQLKNLNIRNAQLKLILHNLRREANQFQDLLYAVFKKHGRLPTTADQGHSSL